jgi:hypothetical protein
MKKSESAPKSNEILLTDAEFLESYNKNMPSNYPRASMELLDKFKDSHQSLFKSSSSWSLDQHRKRLIDWLPQNME